MPQGVFSCASPHRKNAYDVLLTLRCYVEQYGIPREIYTDRGSVYHPKDDQKLTDVGRALTRLGVTMVVAHSPQAKGRVERSNRTHQDRLVKALRREQISAIDQANRFLQDSYSPEHNRRFASLDGLTDTHRSADGIDLHNIFCFETARRVHNDFTVTLNNQVIQLERSAAPLPPPGRSVTVRRWLDDSLHIFWNEHQLAFTCLTTKPKPQYKVVPLPSATHPWRHSKPIGKARYLIGNTKKQLQSIKKKNVVSSSLRPRRVESST